ncbi:CaiB/BaiF CoA transferase family protein [Paraburkholderia caribensis]|uniref:CaiB/BaiF CoA transferase family protein n=1 Tax=Paraburkholderia caribensis TaxID=75105 RepID=UPI001CB122B6|nr:CoA transferase [Paraburkholderia caribensis]CAG9249354.1 Crotonobetainyl-CoA:carnitine CoA-transferase CaiB-like acyl-CoA transferase [Paraburkholderia caribensis]
MEAERKDSQPLDGVRIVDLTSIVLGPLATLTLAGMGAEVIKIEASEGDNVRLAGSALHDDMGHVFLHGNRGKRSVVLNLKHHAARDALLRLIGQADVFLCNVRPAAMRRLGLGPDVLKQTNPRLIQVTACGYGSRGPRADLPAYDDLIQGAVAIPELMQRHTGGEPAYVPLSFVDRVAGLHVVYAITTALYARERSGLGQFVEVPMFESAAHFVLADHLAGESFMPALGSSGYDRLLSTHRRPYRTADGYLCVLIYNDKHWRAFFTAIGQSQMFEQDPRFSTQRNRSINIHEVYGFVAGVMASRTTAEWRDLFDKIDIPNQVPATLDALMDDPQLRASGLIGEEQHPTEGRLRTLGSPTYWNGTPSPTLSAAPRLGEHTREVLKGLGYSEQELEILVQEGAVEVASTDK